MAKQNAICLAIVISIRFYAVRHRNLSAQKRESIFEGICVLVLFVRYVSVS